MTDPPATPRSFKLFIDGRFVRSESGRADEVAAGTGRRARVARASARDLDAAVTAAAAARATWAGRDPADRGPALLRLADAVEARRDDLLPVLAGGRGGRAAARREVEASVDRLVCFAGWADKLGHALGAAGPIPGGCAGVAVPGPVGVVVVVAPPRPPLLGLVSLLAPALGAGNTVVALAGEREPVAASILAEACATAELPPGSANVLTGARPELLPALARRIDVGAVLAASLAPDQRAALRRTVERPESVHDIRLTAPQWLDADRCESPWLLEKVTQVRAAWHTARV